MRMTVHSPASSCGRRAGLSTFFSVGALAGPLLASELYSLFGAHGLFGFLAVTQFCLMGLASYRYVTRRSQAS